MITSHIIACNERLEPADPPWHSNQPIPPGSSILKHPTVGHFATFKRTAYKASQGFDPTLKRAIDLDLYLKLEEQGPIMTLPNKLYLYRKNTSGISQGHNGTLAKAMAYHVMVSAYFRRQATQNGQNLTRSEAKNMRLRQHQIDLHNQYTGIHAFVSLTKTLAKFPELTTNQSLWRNTISAFFRPIKLRQS